MARGERDTQQLAGISLDRDALHAVLRGAHGLRVPRRDGLHGEVAHDGEDVAVLDGLRLLLLLLLRGLELLLAASLLYHRLPDSLLRRCFSDSPLRRPPPPGLQDASTLSLRPLYWRIAVCPYTYTRTFRFLLFLFQLSVALVSFPFGLVSCLAGLLDVYYRLPLEFQLLYTGVCCNMNVSLVL